MDKFRVKLFFKCVLWGIFFSLIFIFIAYLISNFSKFVFKDVLFVEGIFLLMLGFFSSIGGDPMGLSLQGLGSSNAQYVSTSNLKTIQLEKKGKDNNRKVNISFGISGVSLIVSGIVCILINLIK